MVPEDMRTKNIFPYPSLPHPKQTPGGFVFPQVQTSLFPRLIRFDVDFDLPNAFLPEFPPAIYLQNRPELGDVSRGEVVTINNFARLFKEVIECGNHEPAQPHLMSEEHHGPNSGVFSPQ